MNRSGQPVALLLGVLLTLSAGLAGCGGQEAAKSDVQTQPQQSAADAPKPTETSGTESQASQTRVVTDEFGEVTIPVNPQRIAGIYLEDYLVALGVKPIVQWYHPSWGKQDYLVLDVPRFDITGSLEALVEANPDLIIVDGVVDAAKHEMYTKIAPTYRLKEEILQNPPEILKTIADLVNKREQGEKAMAEYKQKVADTKEKLVKALGNETVAVVRLNVGDKSLSLFGIENRYTGNIYKEMGLTPHPLVRDMKEFHEVLSEEAIPQLNADHIIVFPSNGSWTSDENKEAVKILDNPLWKSLPAVKNGHVYIAERTHWQSGAVVANMKKSDDLLKWFVK